MLTHGWAHVTPTHMQTHSHTDIHLKPGMRITCVILTVLTATLRFWSKVGRCRNVYFCNFPLIFPNHIDGSNGNHKVRPWLRCGFTLSIDFPNLNPHHKRAPDVLQNHQVFTKSTFLVRPSGWQPAWSHGCHVTHSTQRLISLWMSLVLWIQESHQCCLQLQRVSSVATAASVM